MTLENSLKTFSIILAGVTDAPQLDAERMLLHVLGRGEASWLYAHGEEELTDEQLDRLTALTARRWRGEPLAYILGEQEFFGRLFFVTPDVLIPRPATEALVEAALAVAVEHQEEQKPFIIADVGTGSGCIAVTLALELLTRSTAPKPHPSGWGKRRRSVSTLSKLRLLGRRVEGLTSSHAEKEKSFHILATDNSRAALKIARRNAHRYGVADRITFLAGDMLAPLRDKRIDLIVSNPPYLPTEALVQAGRARDTKGLLFEPRAALDGGIDGQTFVQRLLASDCPVLFETTGGRIMSL